MIAEMNGRNERLVKLLAEKKLYISSAESCTGGLFSALITDVAGASDVLCESIVTYSNEAKMRELGVRSETLEKYGAVSEDTACQMAEGICRHTGADVGVGITGIAGPGGGTPQKPVGTVYAGICISGKTEVMLLQLKGSRSEVREQTCAAVMDRLIELLMLTDSFNMS